MDHHLPVAHVVLLQLVPLADAPELQDGVAGVRLVLRERNVRLILGVEDPDLHQLRVGDEVERDEVGARLLQRGVLLAEERLRVAAEALGELAGGMPDDLVHVRGHVAGQAAPALGPRFLGLVPGELRTVGGRPREVVGLDHVRQRHRLAAVLLPDGLVVRQVDADRRDRPGVADLDDHVDGVGGDAAHPRLAVARIPRHVVLEPLRVLGQGPDRLRLLAVDVVDERLPRALGAPRVHVDLGEPVDGVDRRRPIGDPGDVVGAPVRRLAGAVPGDQRLERLGHRLGRERNRRLQVPDDLGELPRVAAAAVDAVDLLHQPAAALDQPRVQRIPLVEAFEVGQRDAVVQVVRARQQHVVARGRGLVRQDRIDGGVEEQRLQPIQQRVQRFFAADREGGARRGGRVRRRAERRRRRVEHELAGGEVVVRAGVDPEERGVAVDRLQRRRLDAVGVREDLLERLAHVEVVGVALVVEDVAAGERRVVQVPDEHLLAQVQLFETVGVDLRDGGVVDALEQVPALGVLRRGGARRAAVFARFGRRRKSDAGQRGEHRRDNVSQAGHGSPPPPANRPL